MSTMQARRDARSAVRTWAIIITVVLHAGVLGAAFISRVLTLARAAAARRSNFVDAQLVQLRQAARSVVPAAQGRARSRTRAARDQGRQGHERAAAHRGRRRTRRTIDPLKKTHAELFKNLKDRAPRACRRRTKARSTGSRAGTATEAKGDPYILQLIDQIGSAWTVPTTHQGRAAGEADGGWRA